MANYILEAHRGVATEYPQNTMAAFRAAKVQGYGMIELDTKFTADNHCVIFHDRVVNGIARNQAGEKIDREMPIASLTLQEVLALDVGLSFGEAFRGEKIPTLEEVLAFAVKEKMPLKFDNVIQSHTEKQRNIFFDTVERMGAIPWVGFTSNSTEFIGKIRMRFPAAQIHYDGAVTEESLAALHTMVPEDLLTVWLRFDNARTAWNKTPPVSATLSEMVHRVARLGVWLLERREELEAAVQKYNAQIIETDGSLKP